MNNFEKRLFTHILNARVEPTLLQIAPQEDMDVGPIQDTEEMGPDTRYDMIILILEGLFGATLLSLIVSVLRYLRIRRNDACANKAYEALIKAINKRRNMPGYTGASPAEQGAQLIAILREVMNELDDACKKSFKSMPEIKAIAKKLGEALRESADEVLNKYIVPSEAGLIAYAKRLLEIGSQGAAIRLWLSANNYNFSASEVAWIVGLGLAKIIALGLAIAAAGVVLDLTVWGAPAGVALNVVGAGIVALGLWIYNNQPPDNTDNTV